MAYDEAAYVINTLSKKIEEGGGGGGGQTATISVSTEETSLFGQPVIATNTLNGINFTATFSSLGTCSISVNYIGEYTITCGGYNTSATVTMYGTTVSAVIDSGTVIYGFHANGSLSDPSTIITQISGTENYGYENAYMNLSTGVLYGGDWVTVDQATNEITESSKPFFWPSSCILKYDGTVLHYLDEMDETKTVDGASSGVASSSTAGNAMMEFGRDGDIIYRKVVPDSDGNGASYYYSNRQVDEDYKDWLFRDADGNLADHFYLAKYNGYSDGTRMRSISGQTPLVNKNRSDEISLARANGSSIWDTRTALQWMFIGELLIMMSGSTNTQAKWGRGRVDTNSAVSTGTLNTKGEFYGNSDGTTGVKVFGMEHWWGNIWIAIRGYINDNGTTKVKFTRTTLDGSTTGDYNTTGAGYISISDCTPSGTSGGFISKMKFTEYGAFPKIANGSETTYWCDGLWFNNSQVNYAFVGGGWVAAGRCGAFYLSLLDLASVPDSYYGSALSAIC